MPIQRLSGHWLAKEERKTLGAAVAPPTHPAPALSRGLVCVRKGRMCPRGWTRTTCPERESLGARAEARGVVGTSSHHCQ